jgi:hypothetical protein
MVEYSSGLAPISPMMGAAANVTMPFCRKSMRVSAPMTSNSGARAAGSPGALDEGCMIWFLYAQAVYA